MGIDSHEVMDIFCHGHQAQPVAVLPQAGVRVRRLVPAEGRARAGAAAPASCDVPTPLLDSLLPSNAPPGAAASIDLLLDWKVRRIGFLGLSFKGGTDDLRESPIVEVVETCSARDTTCRSTTPNVSLGEALRREQGVHREGDPAPRHSLMCTSVAEVRRHTPTPWSSANRSDEFRASDDVACATDSGSSTWSASCRSRRRSGTIMASAGSSAEARAARACASAHAGRRRAAVLLVGREPLGASRPARVGRGADRCVAPATASRSSARAAVTPIREPYEARDGVAIHRFSMPLRRDEPLPLRARIRLGTARLLLVVAARLARPRLRRAACRQSTGLLLPAGVVLQAVRQEVRLRPARSLSRRPISRSSRMPGQRLSYRAAAAGARSSPIAPPTSSSSTNESYREVAHGARRCSGGSRLRRTQQPEPRRSSSRGRRIQRSRKASATSSPSSASWRRRTASTTCCAPRITSSTRSDRRDVLFVLMGTGPAWDELQKLVARTRTASRTCVSPAASPTNRCCVTSRAADVCASPDPYNPLNDVSTMTEVDGVHGDGQTERVVRAEGSALLGAGCRRCTCPTTTGAASATRSWTCSTTRRDAARMGDAGLHRIRSRTLLGALRRPNCALPTTAPSAHRFPAEHP